MSLTEGTTVTTSFPFLETGVPGVFRLSAVTHLAEFSNRVLQKSKQPSRMVVLNENLLTDVLCAVGNPPGGFAIRYEPYPFCRAPISQHEEGPTTEPADLDHSDRVLAIYASILVDAGRSQARGDSTRPIRWFDASALSRSRTTEDDDLKRALEAQHNFITTAQCNANVRASERGIPALSKGAKPMPATHEEPIIIGSAEWDTLTERRAELIYRKNREGLSTAEQEEYALLQRKSQEAVNATFKPELPDLDSKLENIEKTRGGNGSIPKK